MNAAAPATSDRFLTFEVDAQLYALRAQDVAEVIHVPALARVPQGPPALLGVANLRGAVLPVASLRVMLGVEALVPAAARAIVLDVGAPVAIVVDAVATLESRDAAQIQRAGEELKDANPSVIGAFELAGAQRVARILDIRALLQAAFARRARTTHERVRATTGVARRETTSANASEMLVTFEVAGQEFALPLAAVQEILPAPSEVTAVARSEAVVIGMTSVRDRLLPLLSLHALLGLPVSTTANLRQKVVVLKFGNAHVGLVADRARAIIAADSALVDPLPPILAARTGGESRIRSVYRGDGGKRLISILSTEQLFRTDVMQQLTRAQGASDAAPAQENSADSQEVIYLVFRLAGDEFGLPIDAVVEVAQVPEQITRVPRTPKFLEGVVNLRGEVLPVVDQRRRFDMPALQQAAGRKLVVVRTARHRAGLIVDGVTDVLRTTAAQIEPPPELTDATSRLVKGVLNLEKSQRIVLLLDPAELLTRAEQGLLDTFQAARNKANA